MLSKILVYILLFDLIVGFFTGILIGVKHSPFLGVVVSVFCIVVFRLIFVRRTTITQWRLRA